MNTPLRSSTRRKGIRSKARGNASETREKREREEAGRERRGEREKGASDQAEGAARGGWRKAERMSM